MYSFQCPHCTQRAEVGEDRLGQIVTCTSCGKPFLARVPTGQLLEEESGEWRPVRVRADETEQTLRMLRPAVFRRAPFKNLALIALIVFGLWMVIWFSTGHGPAPHNELEELAGGTPPPASSAASPMAWLGFFLMLVGITPMLLHYVHSRFESLTITNRRSIWRRGILVKNVSEVEHEDIRNIQVKQGVTDQLLRVGRVSISSAGQNDMEIQIPGVPRPGEVIELVRQQQTLVAKSNAKARSGE